MVKQPYLLAIRVKEGKTAGSQRIIVAEAGRGGQPAPLCDTRNLECESGTSLLVPYAIPEIGTPVADECESGKARRLPMRY